MWLQWCDKSVRDILEISSVPQRLSDWGETPIFIIGNKLDLIQSNPVKMKDLLEGKTGSNENLQKLTAMTTNFLRKKFAFMDFENLLLLSRLSDIETFEEINSWIKEVYSKSAGLSSDSKSIELQNYTLNRCVGWNNASMGDNLRSDFVGFLTRLFKKGRAESLPL